MTTADGPVAQPGATIPDDLARAISAARRHAAELLAIPHVVNVRGGWKFVDGRISTEAAVVVSVDRKLAAPPPGEAIPPAVDGVPTDVRTASPVEQLVKLAATQPAAADALDAATVGAAAAEPFLIDQVQAPAADPLAEADLPVITYQPPPGASLAPVTGAVAITCYVAPENGWRKLQPFIAATQSEFVLGMYDFTAPHIFAAAKNVLTGSAATWRQTIGPRESLSTDPSSNKANDLPEATIITGLHAAGGNRFESVFADVGHGHTFSSAYHIKVAVRDQAAVWLSSGNWQSSNVSTLSFFATGADPAQLRRFNREWNVVVESPALAATFRTYLEGDFETAENVAPAPADAVEADLPALVQPIGPDVAADLPAPEPHPSRTFVYTAADPLTIQPILTPDNYLEVVLELLRTRPQRRLYFQNQSLSPNQSPSPRWAELVQLLAGYSQDASLDVRIIIRDIGDVRKTLESIKTAGFDMDRVKVQTDCHTKGIVIDSETVLLGSHNWTNEGVQVNRDASLLIRRPEIARYYERVFLHDWERMARSRIVEDAMPLLAPGGPGGLDPVEVDALGFDAADGEPTRRIAWSDWLPE